MPGDIILHMHTKNYDHMMYGSWDIMHNRQTDRQTDRKSDILGWVPNLKTSVSNFGKNTDLSTEIAEVKISNIKCVIFCYTKGYYNNKQYAWC